MKTTMAEMKTILTDINGRLDTAGEKVSELRDIEKEAIQTKQQQQQKRERELRDLTEHWQAAEKVQAASCTPSWKL